MSWISENQTPVVARSDFMRHEKLSRLSPRAEPQLQRDEP